MTSESNGTVRKPNNRVRAIVAGELDKDNKAEADVLKSMIDFALGLRTPPEMLVGGSGYVEAQIPGDIVFARDIHKVVIANCEVLPTSTKGKNIKKFCSEYNLKLEWVWPCR